MLLFNFLPLVCLTGTTTTTLETTSTTAAWTPLGCQVEWTAFDTFCYKAVSGTREYTIDQSVSLCREQHREDLVSVHSQEENDFVFNLLENGEGWLNGFFLNGNWIWLDGTAWDYKNWAKDEPGEVNFNLKMSVTGTWVSTDYSQTSSAYVCKRNIQTFRKTSLLNNY